MTARRSGLSAVRRRRRLRMECPGGVEGLVEVGEEVALLRCVGLGGVGGEVGR